MKVDFIKQQIVSNYKQLSKLAKVKSTEPNVVSTWGLVYKNKRVSGFVNQLGTIERGSSAIRIIDGKEIQLQKKLTFSTWKKTLVDINNMLQGVMANLDNKDVVTKKVVDVLCFPKNAVEKLSKLAKN